MSGEYPFFSSSASVRKFPSDLAILPPLICKCSPCIQMFASGTSNAASDCAISFVWWGLTRSMPPAWISNGCPRKCREMAEHSICHPGNPSPHGDGHRKICSLNLPVSLNQSAKSAGLCFSSSTTTSSRAPTILSFSDCPDSAP